MCGSCRCEKHTLAMPVVKMTLKEFTLFFPEKIYLQICFTHDTNQPHLRV